MAARQMQAKRDFQMERHAGSTDREKPENVQPPENGVLKMGVRQVLGMLR